MSATKKIDFALIQKAVINDIEIRALGERLADLYQKSLPSLILTEKGMRTEYDPEIESLANKIKALIEQRKDEIIKANTA